MGMGIATNVRHDMQRDVVIDFSGGVVPEGTTRHGLIVGIDHYADPRLNLRFAVADARILYDLMVDPECGCFPPDNVQLLLNHEATTEGLFRALARLRKQAGENDVVWIYYAGHAAIEDNDRAYWVTHDADVDDLFATALSNDRINTALSKIRAKRIFRILDCCYAEAMALAKNQVRHVVTARKLFGDYQGHGFITLAASNGTQRSVELAELGHGAFTYFLARGLRGEADADNDGVVTADELWSYLRGKVTEASGRAGNSQTPMLIGSMTHDVALTLSAIATATKRRLLEVIDGLVGIRAGQLTTGEGRLCEKILLRGARTETEQSLLESLEEIADGKLTRVQFLRWLNAAKPELLRGDTDVERERGEQERAERERAERERAERERAEQDHARPERTDRKHKPTEQGGSWLGRLKIEVAKETRRLIERAEKERGEKDRPEIALAKPRAKDIAARPRMNGIIVREPLEICLFLGFFIVFVVLAIAFKISDFWVKVMPIAYIPGRLLVLRLTSKAWPRRGADS